MTTVKANTDTTIVAPCNDFTFKSYTTNTWTQIGAQLATQQYRIINIKKKESDRPYFRLKIHLDDNVDSTIIDLYKKSIQKHNKVVEKYKLGVKVLFDAGFDLYSPKDITLKNDFSSVNKIDHFIQCSNISICRCN